MIAPSKLLTQPSRLSSPEHNPTTSPHPIYTTMKQIDTLRPPQLTKRQRQNRAIRDFLAGVLASLVLAWIILQGLGMLHA